MARIEKFEDLECWKKGRDLTKLVYNLTKQNKFVSDFGLRDQIRRASVSVMSNIAEGFSSYSSKEFIRFLRYSIRSSSEVQTHLHIALDQEYILKIDFQNAYKVTEECKMLCKGFIRYLNNKSNKSENFEVL